MLFWLLILPVLVTLQGYICKEEDTLRIMGKGNQAGVRFSWVVRLVQREGELSHEEHKCKNKGGRCGRSRTNNGPICSGSLLNHNWVLGAGHCADATHAQLNTQPATRQGGTQGVLFRKILRVHLHPAFKFIDTVQPISHGRIENDIALYETEEIKMQNYGKLDSRDFPALFGREVYFLGYGLTKNSTQIANTEEKDQEIINKPLMYGTGLYMDCSTVKYRGSLNYMSLYFSFCVMRKCSNFMYLSDCDMGGPVVVDDKIIGVNTFFILDGTVERSEGDLVSVVATPISPYIDWIQNLARKSATDFY